NALPDSGQFIAAIQGVSETRASADPTELLNECGGSTSDLTARKLVEKLLSNITATQLDQMKKLGITMTKPEAATVNDVEIVYFRQYQRQSDLEVLSMFIDLGSGYVPAMGITAKKGEMAQFEKQLFAVASTFQYTPKPCDKAGGFGTATPER